MIILLRRIINRKRFNKNKKELNESRAYESIKEFIYEEIDLFVYNYLQHDYMLYFDINNYNVSRSGPITSSTWENPANLYPNTNEIQFYRVTGGEGYWENEDDVEFYLENPTDFILDNDEFIDTIFNHLKNEYNESVLGLPRRW